MMARTRGLNERGFSMILGNLFNGREPDAVIAIARDADGGSSPRTATSGPASRICPSISRSASSTHRTVSTSGSSPRWCSGAPSTASSGCRWPSHRSRICSRTGRRSAWSGTVLYGITHLLDPLIRVERLYRYLRKFHAFDQQRYVMLRWRQVVVVAIALLLLEFGP